MSLANLIRKREPATFANANPAKVANDGRAAREPLARLAALALANPAEEKPVNPAKAGAADTATASQLAALMTADQEQAVRAWLERIEETDPAIIDDVLTRCRHDAECRDYYLRRAAEHDEGNPTMTVYCHSIAQPELAGDFQ